ncbi:MAG: histidine phosphatase family protein [Chloroflexi bacterium]|nr:histidine phosphatase family protein [Chloroflexota bacterium]
MLRLILVRHGETDRNHDSRTQGHSDTPLNDTGRRQARAVARALEKENLDAVYSSPLARAHETASIIALPHHLSVEKEDGLMELDLGELDGLTNDDIKGQWGHVLREWRRDAGSVQLPGGESMAQLQERAWATIEKIASRHPQGAVVVVSHNLTILSVICKAIQLPLSDFRGLRQGVAAISVLNFDSGGPYLSLLNDTCHLSQPT